MNDLRTARVTRLRPRPHGVYVAILSWPEDADLAAEMADKGHPRLFLVAPEVTPPSDWDPLTDWVRLPADDRDVIARATALQRRVTPQPQPTLDEFDVLWRGAQWTALAPIEARIMELLLTQCGSVVSRVQLRTAWPNGSPGSRAVDARLAQLRERIAGLGLRIHTVRSRGLLLEVTPAWSAGS